MSSSRLARNAAASVAQVLFSATALFLTYRLLAQNLPIEQIGLWALVIGSTAVARLAEFGLGAGVVRYVAGDIGSGRRSSAARTVAMAAICVLLLVGVAAAFVYPFVLPALLTVTPAGLEGAADTLLQCALISVVLGAVGNVFLGALDGCQRMDVRAAIQACGNLVQLIATYVALATGGLGSLGYVQIVQSAFLLVVGAVLAVAFIGADARDYLRFDRARLRQIATYGGALQISAVAQMLFEPLTKVLLTSFGGLALTGYFELANRLILQLRSIIVAAYTALVPHVAARVSDSHIPIDEVRVIYARSFGVLLYIILPCLALVAAGLPLLLRLWLGHFDETLLAITLLQFAGWSVNTLNAPAYFLFIALGKVREPIVSHVVIGVVTSIAGATLGVIWGGAGVLVASCGALMIGSLYLLVSFHRIFNLRWRDLVGSGQAAQAALVVAGTMFSGAVATGWVGVGAGWAGLLPAPLAIGAIALALAVRDPIGRQMIGWLRGALPVQAVRERPR